MKKKNDDVPGSIPVDTPSSEEANTPTPEKKPAVRKRSSSKKIADTVPRVVSEKDIMDKLNAGEIMYLKSVIRGVASTMEKDLRWRVSAEFSYLITDAGKSVVKTRRTCIVENRDTSGQTCDVERAATFPWFLKNIPEVGDTLRASVFRYDGTNGQLDVMFKVVSRTFNCSENADMENYTVIGVDPRIDLVLVDVKLLAPSMKFKMWLKRIFKK